MTYIYENKHPLNALLDAAVYLVAMTLSIIVIAIAMRILDGMEVDAYATAQLSSSQIAS